MPVQFLGKEISVTLGEGDVRRPTAFKLGKKNHAVTEVLATWQDQGYGGLPTQGRRWQDRQQRQFYRLRTAEGEVYEIYVDTLGGGKRHAPKAHWYAHRRITGMAPSEAAAEELPQQRREEIMGG